MSNFHFQLVYDKWYSSWPIVSPLLCRSSTPSQPSSLNDMGAVFSALTYFEGLSTTKTSLHVALWAWAFLDDDNALPLTSPSIIVMIFPSGQWGLARLQWGVLSFGTFAPSWTFTPTPTYQSFSLLPGLLSWWQFMSLWLHQSSVLWPRIL